MSAEHTTLVKGDKVLEEVGNQVVAKKDYVRVLSGHKATTHKENLPNETRKVHSASLSDLGKSYPFCQ